MSFHRSHLLIAALALFVQAPVYAADTHSHHAASPARLSLNHGQKWATDEPLRRSMGELRTLFSPKLAAIHSGKLSDREFATLGGEVERQVGRIVAECKLEAEADAMLHIVIADLMAGAEAMQGKAGTRPAAGAHKVVAALNAYGNTFEHSGWVALR